MKSVAFLLMLSMAGVCAADDPRGIESVYGESRTALLIGNSAYASNPLRNPVNDASDVAELLEQRNFDVMLLTNASKKQMETAIEVFGEKLAQGGVGLFFYAGHAMQVGGINYLLPVDASPRKESDVEFEAVDARRVLAELDSSSNRLNLVILDACRDNPYARSFRSGNSGLARMDAPRGTLIAYATSPGKTAEDGEGRNGTYTQYLLEEMGVPGQEMQSMFKKVRAAVERATAGEQTSEEWNRVTGDFYFTPIDFLDQSLDSAAGELAKLERLLAEQQAADERMQVLEAEKNASLARMEREIESLREKMARPGEADSTLDQLIALAKQREKHQADMEAARARAEEERKAREAEIARLEAEEEARRKRLFDAEYEKYLWILGSEFVQPSEKQQAWKLICRNWNVENAGDTPGRLFWDSRSGTVSISRRSPKMVGDRAGSEGISVHVWPNEDAAWPLVRVELAAMGLDISWSELEIEQEATHLVIRAHEDFPEDVLRSVLEITLDHIELPVRILSSQLTRRMYIDPQPGTPRESIPHATALRLLERKSPGLVHRLRRAQQ